MVNHHNPVCIHDIDNQFIVIRIWIFRNSLVTVSLETVFYSHCFQRNSLEICKQIHVIMFYGIIGNFALFLIYWYSLLELYIRRYFFPSSINSRSIIYIKNNIEYKNPVLDYDFVITTKGSLYSINEDKFEESQGKFIFTEIYLSDRKEKIHFKTDRYNYYLVGNKLDQKFIVYFMNKYYSRSINNYIIRYVDNDVNSGEFNESQSVVFSSSGYTIS
jgi:hypothetical protein